MMPFTTLISWAGRVSPSRHNTSSPDMVFSAFGDGAPLTPAGRK